MYQQTACPIEQPFRSQHTDDDPFSPVQITAAQGAAADLYNILTRVREERMKLVHALKSCEQNKDRFAGPPPLELMQQLTNKVQTLDQAITRRMEKLAQAEKNLDQRLNQVQALQDHVRQIADRLLEQHQAADQLGQRLANAGQELDQQIQRVQTRMEQVAARAADQTRDAIDTLVHEAAQRLEALTDGLVRTINQAKATEQQLTGRLTAVDGRIEQAAAAIQARCNQAEADMDQRITQAAQQAGQQAAGMIRPAMMTLDEHAANVEQRIAAMQKQVEQQIAAVEDQSRQMVDAVKVQLDEHFAGYEHQFEQMLDQAEAQWRACVEKYEPQIEELALPLRQAADRCISESRQRAEKFLNDMLCEIHERIELRIREEWQALEQKREELIRAVQRHSVKEVFDMSTEFQKLRQSMIKAIKDDQDAAIEDLVNRQQRVVEDVTRDVDARQLALNAEAHQRVNARDHGETDQSQDRAA